MLGRLREDISQYTNFDQQDAVKNSMQTVTSALQIFFHDVGSAGANQVDIDDDNTHDDNNYNSKLQDHEAGDFEGIFPETTPHFKVTGHERRLRLRPIVFAWQLEGKSWQDYSPGAC